MSSIDFLPASYRQLTVHRKANVWRLLAGGVFVALIGFSAVYQHLLRRQALADLARTGQQFDRAQALVEQQKELRQQLRLANNEADLFAYLRHPWPTTQVLAAALSPLPDCITLREIRLFQDQAPVVAAAAPIAKQPPKKSEASQPAARLDLDKLREDNDPRPRVLLLSGVTTNTAALQEYLVALGRNELFVKTKLASLEADTANATGAMHFTARLVVRPGYGQPGGLPSAPARSVGEGAHRVAPPSLTLRASVVGSTELERGANRR